MANDIDVISEAFRNLGDAYTVTQLHVKHRADDDGIWFFRKAGTDIELQLESTSGQCPFLIESNQDERRLTAATIDEAKRILFDAFR